MQQTLMESLSDGLLTSALDSLDAIQQRSGIDVGHGDVQRRRLLEFVIHEVAYSGKTIEPFFRCQGGPDSSRLLT